MADSKVSALTELAVQPADSDEFYINDGGVSKRITSITMRTSPVFVTPLLGTPTSGVLTNCTGAPALAITNMTGTGTNLTLVTPTLSGALAGGGNDLNNLGVIFLTEQAEAEADVAGKGQIWVDNLTPNVLKFTDDAGTDHGVVMADGTIAIDTITATAESAEHGAGAIGTAATPTTYRVIERGVIITQFKFDLTGLASVADADDVIGLAAGGAAFIGRNVVATNGIIFKAELACLETPAGGDNDIDLKTSSSATAAYNDDGSAFGSVFNSGDWVAGTCRQNLVPALTANDYFYLTAGTGDVGDTYTAGMFVLTLYGHAVLA